MNSMYIKSFSSKNENVLYTELFYSYTLVSQFFGFYKICGCLILNSNNVSGNNCIYLFIKIMVIFIR